MADQTTREVLEEIRTALKEVAEKVESRPMRLDPVAQQRLDASDQRQDEMLQLLRGINGSVHGHSTALAQQGQWITDHAQVHTELADKVKSIGTKAGIASVVGGAVAVLISIAIKVLGG